MYNLFINNTDDDGIDFNDVDLIVIDNATIGYCDEGFEWNDVNNASVSNITIAYASGSGITLMDSSDINIESTSISDTGFNAVYIADSSSVDLYMFDIMDSGATAIYIDPSSNITLNNIRIQGSIGNAIELNNTNTAALLNIAIFDISGGDGIYINDSINIYMDNIYIYNITDGHGIYIYCEGTSNENITLSNVYINGTGSHGIYVYSVESLVLTNITVIDPGTMGLYIVVDASVSINKVTVVGGTYGIRVASSNSVNITDLLIQRTAFYGIEIYYSTDVFIENGVVSDTSTGIQVYQSNAIIRNVNVTDATVIGIKYMYSSGYIDPVVITDSYNGIEMFYSSDVVLDNITVYNITNIALAISRSNDIILYRITIYDSRIGARIVDSYDVNGTYIAIFNITETPIVTINVHDVLLNVTYPGLLKYFLDMLFYGTITIHNIDYSAVPLPTGGLLPVGVYMNVSLETGSWLWLNYTFNPTILSTLGIAPRTVSWWYWNEDIERWRSIPSTNIIVTPYVGYAIGNYSGGTIIGVFGGPPAVGGEVVGLTYGNTGHMYVLVIAAFIAAAFIVYLVRRCR